MEIGWLSNNCIYFPVAAPEDRIRNHKNRAGDFKIEDDDESEAPLNGDDESIDDNASEVGWNSDDDMAFGYTIGNKRKKSKEESDSDRDVDDEEDGDDFDEENGMLLSDVFNSKVVETTANKHNVIESNSDGEDDHESSSDEEEVHDRLLKSIDAFSRSKESLNSKTQKCEVLIDFNS